jgi:hypothetical protein
VIELSLDDSKLTYTPTSAITSSPKSFHIKSTPKGGKKRTSEVISLSSDDEEPIATPSSKRVAYHNAVKREGELRAHIEDDVESNHSSLSGSVSSQVTAHRDRK